MKRKVDQLEFHQAFESLLSTYADDGVTSIENEKAKYFDELNFVTGHTKDIADMSTLRILDVGGGAGNFCWLAKELWGAEVHMVDRQVEFDPRHERVMGDTNSVIKRLSEKQIYFHSSDPFSDDYLEGQEFDVVVNFDVIEHLPFGVVEFVQKMFAKVSPGGSLILSTPNQVHLRNRLKCLLGKNTWEDFDYYISCNEFFGHIRELTRDELIRLMSRAVPHCEVLGSTHQLKTFGRLRKRMGPAAHLSGVILDSFLPSLSYQLFCVSRKDAA